MLWQCPEERDHYPVAAHNCAGSCYNCAGYFQLLQPLSACMLGSTGHQTRGATSVLSRRILNDAATTGRLLPMWQRLASALLLESSIVQTIYLIASAGSIRLITQSGKERASGTTTAQTVNNSAMCGPTPGKKLPETLQTQRAESTTAESQGTMGLF